MFYPENRGASHRLGEVTWDLQTVRPYIGGPRTAWPPGLLGLILGGGGPRIDRGFPALPGPRPGGPQVCLALDRGAPEPCLTH